MLQPVDIVLVRVVDTSMPDLKKIGAVHTPMNLVFLATWLRGHGYAPEIIDLEVEPVSALEARLKSSPPVLVGITAMTPNIPQARRISDLCHSFGVKTVLGGPQEGEGYVWWQVKSKKQIEGWAVGDYLKPRE